MTKKELIEMLKDVNDNEEITFVAERFDRDGFPYDATANVYKVIGGETKAITEKYGIRRIVKA